MIEKIIQDALPFMRNACDAATEYTWNDIIGYAGLAEQVKILSSAALNPAIQEIFPKNEIIAIRKALKVPTSNNKEFVAQIRMAILFFLYALMHNCRPDTDMRSLDKRNSPRKDIIKVREAAAVLLNVLSELSDESKSVLFQALRVRTLDAPNNKKIEGYKEAIGGIDLIRYAATLCSTPIRKKKTGSSDGVQYAVVPLQYPAAARSGSKKKEPSLNSLNELDEAMLLFREEGARSNLWHALLTDDDGYPTGWISGRTPAFGRGNDSYQIKQSKIQFLQRFFGNEDANKSDDLPLGLWSAMDQTSLVEELNRISLGLGGIELTHNDNIRIKGGTEHERATQAVVGLLSLVYENPPQKLAAKLVQQMSSQRRLAKVRPNNYYDKRSGIGTFHLEMASQHRGVIPD